MEVAFEQRLNQVAFTTDYTVHVQCNFLNFCIICLLPTDFRCKKFNMSLLEFQRTHTLCALSMYFQTTFNMSLLEFQRTHTLCALSMHFQTTALQLLAFCTSCAVLLLTQQCIQICNHFVTFLLSTNSEETPNKS